MVRFAIHSGFTLVKIGLTLVFTRRGQNQSVTAHPSMEGDTPVTSREGKRDKDRDGLKDLLRARTNIFREMSMLLESRRLESQGGPFQGFRSPGSSKR